jgi:hypothetical protein
MIFNQSRLLTLTLILVFLGFLAEAQSISLSRPSSSTSYVDIIPISFSVRDPDGEAQLIQIVFNCTSGPCLTAAFPNVTMQANSRSDDQAFDLDQRDILNRMDVSSNTQQLVNGIYSVYAKYVSPITEEWVFSATNTNVNLDNSTNIPILSTPSSNSTYSSTIPVSLSLTESYASGSAKLTFTNTAGTYSNTLTLANNILNQTFTITTGNISSTNIVTKTYSTLPDDRYNVTLSYQDLFNHSAASVTSSNVLIQTTTPAPTLTSPASGSVITSSTLPIFTYNLPSAPLSGTATLNLSPGYSYPLGNAQSGTYSITSNIPVDGTYTATVSYQDFLGNPASSSAGASITFDRTTLAPTIISPITNSVSTGTITFSYNLPEPAASGTKVLGFSQNGTEVSTLFLGSVNLTTINLNLKNLTAGPTTFSALSGTNNIPDGTYSVTFSYRDQNANPVSIVYLNLTIDSRTLTPTLASPTSGGAYSTLLPISLTLAEAYQSGSAKLIFTNQAGNYSNTITLANGALSQTFTLTTSALASSNNVLTSTYPTLPNGTYNISLTYRDVNGNPENSVVSSNVIIQSSTPVPSLTSPTNGYAVTSLNPPVFTYSLPSAPLSGTVSLNLSPGYSYPLGNAQSGTYTITSNLPVDGTYTATVSYQDFLGNPVASSSPIQIVFKRITNPPTIISPLNATYLSSYLFFKGTLPATASAGSKKISFIKNNIAVSTIVLNNSTSDSLNINLHRLSQLGSSVQSITGLDSLADGNYTINYTYQDSYGNPAASNSVSITKDSSPLIGVLSHTDNVVFGVFTETLTFNKPVAEISPNPIIPNPINNSPSASLGQLIPNSNRTVFTFRVTPLQPGMIKLQAPFEGVARDLAGNNSRVIGIDSILYVDTTIILKPAIVGIATFCQGDSITLTSSVANSYLWSTGATTRSIVVKQSGTYNVKTTYANRVKGLSDNAVIVVKPIPATPTLTQDLTNLVSSNTSGNKWFKNGISISDTTRQIRPVTGGTYTVKTELNGCVSPLSSPFVFVVNTPTPSISSPTNNSYFSSNMLFKGSLPTSNLAGSKKLIISRNNTVVTTIVLNNTQTDSLYINLHRLSQLGTRVQSITGPDSLTDGNYTINYTYQDSYGNPAGSSSVSITKDSSPLIGVLSHTDNVVFGVFTETLTFNKPIAEISPNPIIPNSINNSPSATLGQLIPNSSRTVFTFQVRPLQPGMIKLQAPFEGVARDLAGNNSRIIGIDSILYVDTTIILKPSIIVGNTTFCQGDSTTLVSSVANSYLWSTGAVTRSLVVKQSGSYQVKTTYDNRVKGVSDNVSIVVKPTPAAPTVTRDGSYNLVSSYTSGNKWFKDGVSISDTTQKIIPIPGSTYTVRSVQNGCPSPLSNAFFNLITEISYPNAVEFITLSPNPFVDQLKIEFTTSSYQYVDVQVIEISSGALVASKLGVNSGNSLYLGQLSQGSYIVRLVSPDGKIYQQVKVVKN